jgi:hypothetical protein
MPGHSLRTRCGNGRVVGPSSRGGDVLAKARPGFRNLGGIRHADCRTWRLRSRARHVGCCGRAPHRIAGDGCKRLFREGGHGCPRYRAGTRPVRRVLDRQGRSGAVSGGSLCECRLGGRLGSTLDHQQRRPGERRQQRRAGTGERRAGTGDPHQPPPSPPRLRRAGLQVTGVGPRRLPVQPRPWRRRSSIGVPRGVPLRPARFGGQGPADRIDPGSGTGGWYRRLDDEGVVEDGAEPQHLVPGHRAVDDRQLSGEILPERAGIELPPEPGDGVRRRVRSHVDEGDADLRMHHAELDARRRVLHAAFQHAAAHDHPARPRGCFAVRARAKRGAVFGEASRRPCRCCSSVHVARSCPSAAAQSDDRRFAAPRRQAA